MEGVDRLRYALRDLPSTSSRLLSYSTFSNDFENAVLNAINGGGQNQARAILTGALVGAQVSLAGIPQRFLNGLENAND
jgi:ADP-ribosylglycohydrolase